MQINTCDNCGERIERRESVDIRVGYDHYELCMSCSKPTLKFLEQERLMHPIKKSK